MYCVNQLVAICDQIKGMKYLCLNDALCALKLKPKFTLLYFIEIDIFYLLQNDTVLQNMVGLYRVYIPGDYNLGFACSRQETLSLVQYVLARHQNIYERDLFITAVLCIKNFLGTETGIKIVRPSPIRINSQNILSQHYRCGPRSLYEITYFIVDEPFQNRVKITRRRDIQRYLNELQKLSATKLIICDTVLSKSLRAKIWQRFGLCLHDGWYNLNRYELDILIKWVSSSL